MSNLTPILVDAATLRAHAHRRVTDALKSLFPLDLKGRTLELANVTVHARDYGPEEQKHALLTGGTLEEPVKGTLVLRDANGTVLDEAKNFTLAHLPYFTERHTLINQGNEYQVANQLRRKPGVYTQRSENGTLHTTFNLAKGKNLELGLNPEKGTFYVTPSGTTTAIPLYPVLRALGVDHGDIAKRLGAGVADANAAAYGHRQETAIAKLYQKLVHPAVYAPAATHAAKIDAVRDKWRQTSMDPDVVEHTLGERHDVVSPPALLAAARRLLDVHEGKRDVDDADSLAFKTFHSVDASIAENVGLVGREWRKKVPLLMRGKETIREGLKAAPFTEGIRKFITTSSRTAVPTGINPIELIDHAVKVTSLGEGGIGNERAIPYEARMTHPTHYGTLDPIRTPESGHAGVDIRASIAAHRDDAGNLYTPVYNVKTGKTDHLKAGDLMRYVVAFPHQKIEGMVDAFVNGQVQSVPAARVEYQIPHEAYTLSPATSLIPLLRNIQGNRAIMGSKMQTQGLPLLHREAPLLQVKSHLGDHSMEDVYGRMVVPTAPVRGTVAKIENGFVYIRPDLTKKGDLTRGSSDQDLVKVPFQTHFPFPSKTYLHHDLHVKPGDEVHAGQTLGDSNFTRKGTLALGTNLTVAYMPYRGLNSNDAVVISEGASKKLTSEHMYREVYPIGVDTVLNREKHKAYYGPKYAPDQYAKLDADGVVKKGARVLPKDLLVVGLTPSAPSGTDVLLGKISKSLTRPFREHVLHWEHGTPGEVVEVVRTPKQIAILVRTQEPMTIGDKLAGRYGNKGVVAKIIPDHEMVRGEDGKPIDLVMTSAGVVSRINPAQIIETAVTKVADKTGQPIIYDNAQQHDAVQWAKDLLAKHGVKDKEHVHDPVSGRTLKGHDGKGVLVGKQYIFKLFKSTDTNFSGHAVGPYDINEQPLKVGGEDSAKGIGKMEFDALLAHNAKNILREAATIRGQKNDEFWRAVQLGLPLPAPKPSFAFQKFTAMLEGAGVKVDKRNSKFKLLPLTDRDVAARSSGSVQNNKTVTGKDLKPESGGLFDPRLTGGPDGRLFAHIDLHEPVVNPVFEEPVRRLLGMTEKQFNDTLAQKGGKWIKQELHLIDVPKKIAELRAKIHRASGTELNNLVKQVKYLEALEKEGLRPHEAYVISKVPVVPPVFRPITPMPNDPTQLMVADANKLYGHLLDVNHALKHTVLPSDLPTHRGALYNAVGAVFGTHDVNNDELKGQSVKGFLGAIAGRGSPKGGFFQRKLMARTQDVSGRGTAVPDGNLGMDQVGIPEEMLWKMWDRLLVARLVRAGHGAVEAREQVDKRTPSAREALRQEIKERPVLINRAPTLHRYSVVAAYPVPVAGKTIRVNPFIEQGMNLDYDGDTLQVHTPVTSEGVHDATRMTMPHLLLSDQQRNKLVAFPQHEAIIGVTHATAAKPSDKPVRVFDHRDDVLKAYRKGEIHLHDPIEVRGTKTAEEDEPTPSDTWDKLATSLDADTALALAPPELVLGDADDA